MQAILRHKEIQNVSYKHEISQKFLHNYILNCSEMYNRYALT